MSDSVAPTLAVTYASSDSSIEKDINDAKDPSTIHAEPVYPLAPAGSDNSSPRLTDHIFNRKRLRAFDLDAVATQPSVFDDPGLAKQYRPTEKWENLSNFDPSFRWTWREEKAVIKKIDIRVLIWACVGFAALNIDRYNISQANTDGIIKDLGMDTNDFNLGNTIFRLTFLAAELPSQLVSKAIGPDRWIPMQMIGWSVTTLCQFWLTNRTGFLVCRALIGFVQGGFIPDMILYLSYFYKTRELPMRLAWFWVAHTSSGIVSSLLSIGILKMRGIGGKTGWQWLFLLEGILTVFIGIATFFMMPSSISKTKTWFRPNGWFTEREEKIAVMRLLRDDHTKGDIHNRQALSFRMVWDSLTDYHLWPIYLQGFLFSIPGGPPDTYLTLSLRQLGFSKTNTNLLTIPSDIGHIVFLLIITLLSEVWNERAWLAATSSGWILPFLVAIYVRNTPEHPIKPWAFFGLITGLLSHPYVHAIQVAWISSNSGSVRSRTVGSSVYNMFCQVGSIAAANIYQEDDKPYYRRGNSVLIAVAVVNIVLYPAIKAMYVWTNKRRERIWGEMSTEERAHYLDTTTNKGNRRLDFQFLH